MRSYKMTIWHLSLWTALLLNCSGPRMMLSPEIRGKATRIAVLSFSSSGSFSGRHFGRYAADLFARELALQKRAVVIDRGFSNAVAAEHEIASSAFFSPLAMRQTGRVLAADVVAVGEIINVGENTLSLTQNSHHFFISVRLLDPEAGDILGVISHDRQGNGRPELTIQALVREMVDSLGNLRPRKKSEPKPAHEAVTQNLTQDKE